MSRLRVRVHRVAVAHVVPFLCRSWLPVVANRVLCCGEGSRARAIADMYLDDGPRFELVSHREFVIITGRFNKVCELRFRPASARGPFVHNGPIVRPLVLLLCVAGAGVHHRDAHGAYAQSVLRSR